MSENETPEESEPEASGEAEASEKASTADEKEEHVDEADAVAWSSFAITFGGVIAMVVAVVIYIL